MQYISWSYFYHAWQLSPVRQKEECDRLRADAEHLAAEWQENGFEVLANLLVSRAYSEGDDIVLVADNDEQLPIPMLRQQASGNEVCLCLADFVPPKNVVSEHSKVALFCTTVPFASKLSSTDPYQSLLEQTLSFRLAEAAAELLHLDVRKRIIGFAADESLSVEDILQGRYQGIRPAVGYPSLPDLSLNFLFNNLLNMESLGIRITENGAMSPHATVTGFIFSHPQSRYFSVGAISDDQMIDYSQRRGIELKEIRRFFQNL